MMFVLVNRQTCEYVAGIIRHGQWDPIYTDDIQYAQAFPDAHGAEGYRTSTRLVYWIKLEVKEVPTAGEKAGPRYLTYEKE
jgi:hypothetical protein